MKKAKIFKRSLACLSAAATILSSSMVTNVNAAVITEGKPNNYDNFAEALQLALCFYDANKCGDEVADDGYYSWRGNCHVKDAEIPLQPMNPMPELYGEAKNDGSQNGKEQEKKEDEQPKGEGDGDGGLSAAKGLYEGVNMSSKFIEANRKYLDPDGDGLASGRQSSQVAAETLQQHIRMNGAHVAGLVGKDVVDRRDGLHPSHVFLQDVPDLRIGRCARLQIEDAGHELQIVLHPVVNFPQFDAAAGLFRAQLRIDLGEMFGKLLVLFLPDELLGDVLFPDEHADDPPILRKHRAHVLAHRTSFLGLRLDIADGNALRNGVEYSRFLLRCGDLTGHVALVGRRAADRLRMSHHQRFAVSDGAVQKDVCVAQIRHVLHLRSCAQQDFRILFAQFRNGLQHF